MNVSYQHSLQRGSIASKRVDSQDFNRRKTFEKRSSRVRHWRKERREDEWRYEIGAQVKKLSRRKNRLATYCVASRFLRLWHTSNARVSRGGNHEFQLSYTRSR